MIDKYRGWHKQSWQRSQRRTCTSARHIVIVPSWAGLAFSACPSGVYTALSSRSSARLHIKKSLGRNCPHHEQLTALIALSCRLAISTPACAAAPLNQTGETASIA